jgi:hypothetical protein
MRTFCCWMVNYNLATFLTDFYLDAFCADFLKVWMIDNFDLNTFLQIFEKFGRVFNLGENFLLVYRELLSRCFLCRFV